MSQLPNVPLQIQSAHIGSAPKTKGVDPSDFNALIMRAANPRWIPFSMIQKGMFLWGYREHDNGKIITEMEAIPCLVLTQPENYATDHYSCDCLASNGQKFTTENTGYQKGYQYLVSDTEDENNDDTYTVTTSR